MTARLRRPLLLAAIPLAIAGFGARAQSCPGAVAAPGDSGLALVLSGGAARGLAHIGVLRVLDSIGVRPSLVVGTSMGALVGALYAGGLSGRELDSLVRELPFATLFRRYEPITFLTAGTFTEPVAVLPPTFVVEVHAGRMRLQSPIAREPEIDALFNQLLLRANLTAAGDFDRLPIRFRAVATDMRARRAVVLGAGDLPEAVRASIAIPVVFAPVERDGRLLVDGGLTANVPVAIARANGARRVLVSDVGANLADTTDPVETRSMLAYLVDELFSQLPDSLGSDDLLVRPPVSRYNPLEFSQGVTGRLIDAGYQSAVRALRGCPVPPPSPGRWRVRQPARLALAAPIGDRLARLADERVYESVWLRPLLGDTTGGDGEAGARVTFAPIATPTPESVLSAGLTYEAQEGARVWIATRNVTPIGGRVSVGSVLSLGEWRQQVLVTATGLRRHPVPRGGADSASRRARQVSLPDPRSNRPPWSTLVRDLVRPELSLTATHETVRLYDADGHEGERPVTRDVVAFGGVGRPPSARRGLAFGAVAHLWSIRNTAFSTTSEGSAFGAMLRAATSGAPIGEGPDPGMEPRLALEGMWLDRYHRAFASGDGAFRLGKVIVQPRGALGWGEHLPLGAQFVLGGTQGFPGLRLGERRAERMAFGSAAALRRIVGPLYGRAAVGIGTTSLTRARQPELLEGVAFGTVRGAEVGIAADTPLGPFSLGVGVASNDRTVFKIRLGN